MCQAEVMVKLPAKGGEKKSSAWNASPFKKKKKGEKKDFWGFFRVRESEQLLKLSPK